MAFYTNEELNTLGFKSIGKNVLLSKLTSIYNAKNISIGDNSRIDDFCVISAGVGEITLGCNVHIAVYTSLIGRGKITISDYCNISSRVSLYSSSDDYSGNFMTNPIIPDKYTNITSKDVFLHKHVIIGCGSVILPGAILFEGVAIGALSMVTGRCEQFCIYAGVPVKKISARSRGLLVKCHDFEEK